MANSPITPVTAKATGTDDSPAQKFAPGFAPTSDKSCTSASSADKTERKRKRQDTEEPHVVSLESVKRKHPSSTADNGRHQVERKGLEPSASALRTQPKTTAKKQKGSLLQRVYADRSTFASRSKQTHFFSCNSGTWG